MHVPRAALVLLCLGLAFAADEEAEQVNKNTDIVTLTKEDFDLQTSQGFWLVRFHATWCNHCKRMKPAWEELATKVKPLGYRIGDVDAPKEKDLAKRFGVRGYPTIFFIHGEPENRISKQYDGDHTVDEMEMFLTKMSKPPIQLIAAEDEIAPLISADPIVILFGEDVNDLYTRVATAFQPRHSWFYHYPKAALDSPKMKEMGVDALPAVMVLSTEFSRRYVGPWVQDPLQQWVSTNRHPLLTRLTRSVFPELRSMNKLLVFAVVNSAKPELSNRYTDFFRTLAAENTDERLFFLSVDAGHFNQFVRHYGVKQPQDIPRVMVLDSATQESWVDPGIDVWNPSEVRTFLASVSKGYTPPGLQPVSRKIMVWFRKYWKIVVPVTAVSLVALVTICVCCCCTRPSKKPAAGAASSPRVARSPKAD
ncbi:putative protein disulfide-isomerase TMX3 [Paratrimastix pyriformis]|uniref:Thioredoxin domain-containing protein n=1 Tax=Paratrimastix pyriformis TaxID=342808 RepID=A0ABQ8UJ37_9EUKA|nr:putative protein disulfide-isomerase TMX3 [Paratrimastix pyriformis]